MPVETRNMEHVLATIVDNNNALFNDSAIAHIEHSLGGSEFVLVGVSSHMKTTDLEWLILHCGGILSKHVTDQTSFVIKGSRVGDTMHKHSGNVEDLQVYKDAVLKKTKILSTLNFFQLIGQLNPSLSIKNIVDGWHENITFSLRDTSAYGLTNREAHKYSLELAKSNRSRCHGHCKKVILAGEIRLKACFDPLTDSFVYFRCLKCITPAILDHIEKEWKTKGHGDSMLDFAVHQRDEILRLFQTPGAEPAVTAPPDAKLAEITPDMRLQLAQNLTDYLTKTSFEEAARRQEEHALEKEAKEKEAKEAPTGSIVIPIEHEGEVLGKRKRHETFASAEMQDFMHNIPPSVLRSSSVKDMHSVKVTTTNTTVPTQLVM